MGDGLEGVDNVMFDMNELELSNEVIGAGQFGEVTKAILYGTDVCLKRMILSDDVDEDNKYIERELRVLQSIHHPNIMQFMGVCKQKEHTYLVTEFVEGGNLRELLKGDKNLAWPTRVRMAADAATAMAYLHQKHIMHRDLKSNNLLVDHQLRIKVCDFGFARTITTNQKKNQQRARAMTLCGTDEWMAPEVILGLPYNEKADVFSFGIVLVEIMTRKRPDENMKKRTPQLKYQVFPDEIKAISPKDCPPDLIQMAQECTNQDPEDRPDMKEVARRLRMLMKQLLDEEDLKKAATELEKKKAKSITKVELHINNVQINSVAVFAIEDQTTDQYIKAICDVVNNRVSAADKVVPTGLVLASSIQGVMVPVPDGELPFNYFSDHVGVEKNFCFHLFSMEKYLALANNAENAAASRKGRSGSIFGRRGSQSGSTMKASQIKSLQD
jgi:LIM domain kinase 1